MKDEFDLALTHDDRHSMGVQKMLRRLEKRLESLRAKNDDDEGSMTFEDTIRIRAQIKETKELRRFLLAPAVSFPD